MINLAIFCFMGCCGSVSDASRFVDLLNVPNLFAKKNTYIKHLFVILFESFYCP